MPLTPLQLGQDLLDRSGHLAKLAGSPPSDPWTVESDVLRAAWTFVGAAVDTYFHERVRGALLTIPLSPSAKKFGVPLGSVDELIGGFLQDRARSRPRVRLKSVIHDALLKETYQGSRNVETAFALMARQRVLGDHRRWHGRPGRRRQEPAECTVQPEKSDCASRGLPSAGAPPEDLVRRDQTYRRGQRSRMDAPIPAGCRLSLRSLLATMEQVEQDGLR